MFINIPVPESIQLLSNKIPHNLVPLVQHCPTSTYSVYQGEYYKQTSGTATGSPISPEIVNIYIEYLEERILKEVSFKLSEWFPYVNDVL